jgi:CDP-glucose 4,6-dehydratase
VIIVTSDKCYRTGASPGHREDEPMGGDDIYSVSKGAAELVTAAWRQSYFDPAAVQRHGVAIASARAGNVVGGGDWARDRLVPDAIAALTAGRPVPVRNPEHIRPFQHVLEPLSGYLLLGARLMGPDGGAYAEAWNFGPRPEEARPVREAVEALIGAWGSGSWVDRHEASEAREAPLLRLSIDKAAVRLGWQPRWGFKEAFERAVEWYRAFYAGASAGTLSSLCQRQIREYHSS